MLNTENGWSNINSIAFTVKSNVKYGPKNKETLKAIKGGAQIISDYMEFGSQKKIPGIINLKDLW